MLKKLTIRNFKAIQDMTIEFTPLTVLIGGNGCGKSTVLQALDFLRSAATRDIPEYLWGKGWTFFDLKSQLNEGGEKPIEFIATFTFMLNNKSANLEWFFSINCSSIFQTNWDIQEKITDKETNEVLLSHGFNNNHDVQPMAARSSNAYAGSPAEFAQEISFDLLNLETSALKVASPALVKEPEKVFELKKFLAASSNFELLSPERMRGGNDKKNIDDIGTGGESLAIYIDRMPNDQKEELEKLVSGIIGVSIKIHIDTVNGKYIIHIIEFFANGVVDTTAMHISDGLLRIIAFAAIMQKTKMVGLATQNGDFFVTQSGERLVAKVELRNGMILLDEIEDGINPYLTERIILLLRGLVEKSGRQVIITTHSPIMLNDFKPEEIVFLWKDKNGAVNAKSMFSTEEMKRTLKVLNPGEVWVNYEKEEILQRLYPDTETRGNC